MSGIFHLTLFILNVFLSTFQHGCSQVPESGCVSVDFGMEHYTLSLIDVSHPLKLKQIGATLYFYTTSDTSKLYTSNDGGKTLQNQTPFLKGHKINNIVSVSQDTALLVLSSNSLPSQSLIMLSEVAKGSVEFVGPRAVQFKFHGELTSHPKHPGYLATLGIEESEVQVYISTDMGLSWKPVMRNATDVKWDSGCSQRTNDVYLYMLVNTSCASSQFGMDLVKTAVNSGSFTIVIHEVKKFTVLGKYLIALVYNPAHSDETLLRVSTSQGRVFNEVLFPETVKVKDFTVLDAPEEEFAFLHVTETEGSKVGTLYIPDSDGIVYEKSLKQHKLADSSSWSFKSVPSMKGTFLAQQVRGDETHTVLTFNSGRKWNEVPCSNNSTLNNTDCRLKFLGPTFGGAEVQVPSSTQNRHGLPVLMAHGTVFRNGSSDDINLYVSNNGGYTWYKGPSGRPLVSADTYGSLLVAVFQKQEVAYIKYSLNAGRHWSCIAYNSGKSEDSMKISLSINASLAVVIMQLSTQTHILTINFTSLVNNTCTTNDLHVASLPVNSNHGGCFRGAKETFWMQPETSSCIIDDPSVISRSLTPCPCTQSDYECDFGFMRIHGVCAFNYMYKDSALDICQEGDEPTIQTTRYRKMEVSKCKDGWDPRRLGLSVYRRACLYISDHVVTRSKVGNALIALIVVVVVIGTVSLAALFFHKLQQLRKQLPAYRYSKLNQDDQNQCQAADEDSNETLVDLSSEEEEFEPADQSPAKLLVQSRTVSGPSPPLANGLHPVQKVSEESIKNLLEDTDDELLQ